MDQGLGLLGRRNLLAAGGCLCVICPSPLDWPGKVDDHLPFFFLFKPCGTVIFDFGISSPCPNSCLWGNGASDDEPVLG